MGILFVCVYIKCVRKNKRIPHHLPPLNLYSQAIILDALRSKSLLLHSAKLKLGSSHQSVTWNHWVHYHSNIDKHKFK